MGAGLEADFQVLAVAGAARDAGVAWAAIVGGYVRDCLLGVPAFDLDLVVPDRGAAVASRVADALGGKVVLPSRWRQWMVPAGRLRVDVTEAADLETDLRRRDFTVNAIAWRVLPMAGRPLDALDGLGDLQAGRLELCSPAALSDDPARVLRAARLAACGLTPSRRVLRASRTAAQAFGQVSPDRVRSEWGRLAQAPSPLAGLELLATSGALASWLQRGVVPRFLEWTQLPGQSRGVSMAWAVWNALGAHRPAPVTLGERLGLGVAERESLAQLAGRSCASPE
jgi:tRNA nucleotidyltransferase/poly(A) polymerase